MAKSDKAVQLTEHNPYTMLTMIQKNYVEARLQGLTSTAACRAAGVMENRATQLSRNPKVVAAIRYLINETTKNVDLLTKSDVLSGMMDAVNAAATSAELVMAWREIGKLLGSYEPTKRILEIHDYSKDELKELSDNDLRKMAGGRMADAVDAEFHDITPSANPMDKDLRIPKVPAQEAELE